MLTRRGRAVVAELAACEAVTGSRPLTCPWRGFAERDVQSVLAAHAFASGTDGGALREWWGDDPPYWMVVALAHYRRVLDRARLDTIKADREERKRRGRQPMSPLAGSRVDHEIRG